MKTGLDPGIFVDTVQKLEKGLAAEFIAAGRIPHGYHVHRPFEQVAGEFLFVKEVALGLAGFDLEQGRLGDVNESPLDQGGHLPEKEGQ